MSTTKKLVYTIADGIGRTIQTFAICIAGGLVYR